MERYSILCRCVSVCEAEERGSSQGRFGARVPVIAARYDTSLKICISPKETTKIVEHRDLRARYWPLVAASKPFSATAVECM